MEEILDKIRKIKDCSEEDIKTILNYIKEGIKTNIFGIRIEEELLKLSYLTYINYIATEKLNEDIAILRGITKLLLSEVKKYDGVYNFRLEAFQKYKAIKEQELLNEVLEIQPSKKKVSKI